MTRKDRIYRNLSLEAKEAGFQIGIVNENIVTKISKEEQSSFLCMYTIKGMQEAIKKLREGI